MSKEKQVDHPIHPLLSDRWSPRLFSERQVSRNDLLSILEAARWAPSAFNEQPWRFIYGFKGSPEFDVIHSCLKEGNQSWTKDASVLILTFSKDFFDRNQKPNNIAKHDLGLAAMSMVIEAQSKNIFTHQMAGIEADKIIVEYKIPEGFTPFTGIALGYLAAAESLNEEQKKSEYKVQSRNPIPSFAGEGNFIK